MTDIEIIKDCYRVNKIEVDQDYLDNILKDKKRVQQFRELHEREKKMEYELCIRKTIR